MDREQVVQLISAGHRARRDGDFDLAQQRYRAAAESEDPSAEYVYAQFLKKTRRGDGVLTWEGAYGHYLVRAASHGSLLAQQLVQSTI